MPVVGLDTWAIIVALAGAVGILWRYVAMQNEKALADKDKQIAALMAAVDKQGAKLDELQDALIDAASGVVEARKVIEVESKRGGRK